MSVCECSASEGCVSSHYLAVTVLVGEVGEAVGVYVWAVESDR